MAYAGGGLYFPGTPRPKCPKKLACRGPWRNKLDPTMSARTPMPHLFAVRHGIRQLPSLKHAIVEWLNINRDTQPHGCRMCQRAAACHMMQARADDQHTAQRSWRTASDLGHGHPSLEEPNWSKIARSPATTLVHLSASHPLPVHPRRQIENNAGDRTCNSVRARRQSATTNRRTDSAEHATCPQTSAHTKLRHANARRRARDACRNALGRGGVRQRSPGAQHRRPPKDAARPPKHPPVSIRHLTHDSLGLAAFVGNAPLAPRIVAPTTNHLRSGCPRTFAAHTPTRCYSTKEGQTDPRRMPWLPIGTSQPIGVELGWQKTTSPPPPYTQTKHTHTHTHTSAHPHTNAPKISPTMPPSSPVFAHRFCANNRRILAAHPR